MFEGIEPSSLLLDKSNTWSASNSPIHDGIEPWRLLLARSNTRRLCKWLPTIWEGISPVIWFWLRSTNMRLELEVAKDGGIGPVILLEDVEKYWRNGSLPKSSSKVPTKELLKTRRLIKFVQLWRLDSTMEMFPLKLLFDISKVVNWVSCPNDIHVPPTKLLDMFSLKPLFDISKAVKLVNCPNDMGISPTKLLDERYIDSRDLHPPMVLGIWPEREFFESSRSLSNVILPNSCGSSPRREFEDKSKYTKFFMLQKSRPIPDTLQHSRTTNISWEQFDDKKIWTAVTSY